MEDHARHVPKRCKCALVGQNIFIEYFAYFQNFNCTVLNFSPSKSPPRYIIYNQLLFHRKMYKMIRVVPQNEELGTKHLPVFMVRSSTIMWLCVSVSFCFVSLRFVKKISCLNDQAYNCLIHFYSKLI